MKKVIGLLLIFTALIFAAIPKQISYQGILTDALGQPKADGAYVMTFKLYDVATEGFNIWSETKTVNVKGGVFTTTLGSDSVLGLSFDTTYWLGISVAGGAEFTPRVQLTASGYAIRSVLADSSAKAYTAQVSLFADSSLKAYSSDISTVADSAVRATNADQATVAATATSIPITAIAANSIDSTKLGASSVGSEEIADGAIVTADVAATFKAPYADSADTAGYATFAGTVLGTSISGKIVTDTIMAIDSNGLSLLNYAGSGIRVGSNIAEFNGYVKSYANNIDSGFVYIGSASSGSMIPLTFGMSESESIGLGFLAEPKNTAQKGFSRGAFQFNARGNSNSVIDSGIILNVQKNNDTTLMSVDINGNMNLTGSVAEKNKNIYLLSTAKGAAAAIAEKAGIINKYIVVCGNGESGDTDVQTVADNCSSKTGLPAITVIAKIYVYSINDYRSIYHYSTLTAGHSKYADFSDPNCASGSVVIGYY